MRNLLEASFGLALTGVAALGCGSESLEGGPSAATDGTIAESGVMGSGVSASASGLPTNNDPHTVDYCKQGMTIGTMKIDVKAERCHVTMIPELIKAAGQDPEMWLLAEFLEGPVTGKAEEYQALIQELPDGVAWAELQCSPYEDAMTGDVRYCAHIVDRYPDGSPIDDTAAVLKNFFMLYVPDEYVWGQLATAGVYWEHARLGLTKPDYTEVPVELQGVGYVDAKGEWSPEPPQESMLVGTIGDPRDCGSCVDRYYGPNSHLVLDAYQDELIEGSFNPAFTFSSCEFEVEPSVMAPLDPTSCQAEQTYRTNR